MHPADMATGGGLVVIFVAKADIATVGKVADRGDNLCLRCLGILRLDLSEGRDFLPQGRGHALRKRRKDELRHLLKRSCRAGKGADQDRLIDAAHRGGNVSLGYSGGNVPEGEDRLAHGGGKNRVLGVKCVQNVIARGRRREVQDRAHPGIRGGVEGAGRPHLKLLRQRKADAAYRFGRDGPGL